MKRCLSVILILCLFAPLLAGCAAELPPLPPLPGKETPAAETPGEPVAEEPAPAPVEVKALDLTVTLPAPDAYGEETVWYFSPEEEFDCAFSYPAYCTQWFEKGAVRFDPGWFFARMFFTSVRKDDEGAPEEMVELLEPGKWGATPGEGTVGSGWNALRMLHLKYDTWRTWVAWETPDRYYLLYGSCFDGREEIVGSIFETIAASFLTNGEMLASSPARGETLFDSGALTLGFDGAALRSTQEGLILDLRLSVKNTGEEPCAFAVSALDADGGAIPFDDRYPVGAHEGGMWYLSLPLTAAEGALVRELGFSVAAEGVDAPAPLPVSIHITQ